MTLIVVFVALLFLYSLVSSRLAQTIITAPIIFTAVGALAFILIPGLEYRQGNYSLFLHLAEIGLVMLLFTDASRTDLNLLKSIRSLPTRLLSFGMLLTIVLGGGAALLIFPSMTFWEAGILAAILAPTDAGLGQIIVNDKRVPTRVRQTLNVEAGLNDGLSVPFLLFFMALAGIGGGDSHASLWRYLVEQLVVGTGIGLAIGLLGGWLIHLASHLKWMAPSRQQLAVVALPLLCILASRHQGASMFIAAFVAGLAVQVRFKPAGKHSVEFTEEWGELINLSVFLLFGVVAARHWEQFSMEHVVYGVLSLTIVRILPVAIALWGTGLSRATVFFMGWFGPRGLASIVLALVYLHEAHQLGELTILLAATVTILMSIFAHGTSARSGIDLYSRRIAGLPPHAPEF